MTGAAAADLLRADAETSTSQNRAVFRMMYAWHIGIKGYYYSTTYYQTDNGGRGGRRESICGRVTRRKQYPSAPFSACPACKLTPHHREKPFGPQRPLVGQEAMSLPYKGDGRSRSVPVHKHSWAHAITWAAGSRMRWAFPWVSRSRHVRFQYPALPSGNRTVRLLYRCEERG